MNYPSLFSIAWIIIHTLNISINISNLMLFRFMRFGHGSHKTKQIKTNYITSWKITLLSLLISSLMFQLGHQSLITEKLKKLHDIYPYIITYILHKDHFPHPSLILFRFWFHHHILRHNCMTWLFYSFWCVNLCNF